MNADSEYIPDAKCLEDIVDLNKPFGFSFWIFEKDGKIVTTDIKMDKPLTQKEKDSIDVSLVDGKWLVTFKGDKK